MNHASWTNHPGPLDWVWKGNLENLMCQMWSEFLFPMRKKINKICLMRAYKKFIIHITSCWVLQPRMRHFMILFDCKVCCGLDSHRDSRWRKFQKFNDNMMNHLKAHNKSRNTSWWIIKKSENTTISQQKINNTIMIHMQPQFSVTGLLHRDCHCHRQKHREWSGLLLET